MHDIIRKLVLEENLLNWSGLNQQTSFQGRRNVWELEPFLKDLSSPCSNTFRRPCIHYLSRPVLPLNWLTKVAKSTIFLLSLTLVTFHNCIACIFNHIPFFMFGPQFFLSCHLLLMLFSLAGFLLRHFDSKILLEIVKRNHSREQFSEKLQKWKIKAMCNQNKYIPNLEILGIILTFLVRTIFHGFVKRTDWLCFSTSHLLS